jgi:endonuclease/exonuclease/phosphatase (EEP) superfamily protein YafD
MTVHVEYDQLAWLAGQVETATESLDDGRAAIAETPYVSNADFGGEAQCAQSYRSLESRAIAAARMLAEALAADAEKMRRMVEVYDATDQETADRMFAAAGTTLDVYSAHVHSHDDGLTSEQSQAIRAGQIDELVDVAGSHEGPAIVGADLNTERGEGTPSSDAVDGFETQLGFTNYAGDVPPTGSGGTREIDYVFGGPQNVVVDADLVETDGLSDHEGQNVEIEVNRW